jgi:uncharacterized protein (DUF1684 family)
MKKIILLGLLFSSLISFAQKNNYIDSLSKFQHDYVITHDVVKGADTAFLQFFPINSTYRVYAIFKKINDSIGFDMQVSSGYASKYFKYGSITFSFKNKTYQLFIYQWQYLMKIDLYKDFLFIPFSDLSNGFESYGGGRYIDLRIADIKNNVLEIDFNKAYNPSCAYRGGYSCPIPPKENNLQVAINAGEKTFGKPIH